MTAKKLIIECFAAYGVACAASKLSKVYLDENGKRIATGVAAKIIDMFFDEYEPKDHQKRPISFETRNEAKIVLDEMSDIIRDYGNVTIADLYDLVGIHSNGKDSIFGWTDLDRAHVVRKRYGDYRLSMRKPHKVNK